jgi:membrane protein involved in colicin uptake
MSVGASVVHPDQSATPASAPTRKQQLQALKLELKRLKLELREMENLQLLQPQQRKQALQQHIFRLEEQILALESQPI